MKDKYYKYFNPNPEGNEDAADCVIRALKMIKLNRLSSDMGKK